MMKLFSPCSLLLASWKVSATMAAASSSSPVDLDPWVWQSAVQNPRWMSFSHDRFLEEVVPGDDISNVTDGTIPPVAPPLPPCNEILDSFTLAELQFYMDAGIDLAAAPGTTPNQILRSLFLDGLQTGVQIRRVCTSCVKELPEGHGGAYDDFCGSDIYGNDIDYSAIVILPTTADDSSVLAPGTHPAMFWMHGTTLKVPSTEWQGRNSTDTAFGMWTNLAMASTSSVTLIAPDYMGFASSATESFKAILVQRAYATAIVPIWWNVKRSMAQESDCQTALADSAYLAGYSEGGYSSVSLARTLKQSLGVDIIRVHASGAPFRVSSESFLTVVEFIDDGSLDPDTYYTLSLLGVAYSSTYPHVLNYNTNQNLLEMDVRDAILEHVSNLNATVPGINALFQSQIGVGEDATAPFDDNFIAQARDLLAAGNRNPCQTLTVEDLESRGMDKVCEAFLENDLALLLEDPTEIDFPVELCHSPQDTLISYANLPNVSANPDYLTFVPGSSGDHFQGAEFCVFQVWQYVRTANFVVSNLHQESCTSSDATPTASPVEIVADVPTASPVMMDSDGTVGVGYYLSLWASVLVGSLVAGFYGL